MTGKNILFTKAAIVVFLLTLFAGKASAVLKEENLEKTLSILRSELTTQYREQAARAAMQERRTNEV